jgi:hypothetical protein
MKATLDVVLGLQRFTFDHDMVDGAFVFPLDKHVDRDVSSVISELRNVDSLTCSVVALFHNH